VPVETAPHGELEAALRRVAELEAALTTTSAALATVTAERDKLRHAYEQMKGHLELLRRRIFLAKAERIEFAETKAKLDKLAKELGPGDLTEAASDNDNDTSGDGDGGPRARRRRSRPAAATSDCSTSPRSASRS
jgi:chromosome segregation ATPase